MPPALLLAVLPVTLSLAGCRAHSTVNAQPTADQRAELRAELEDEREQLNKIPPPAKSRYMAIHSFESWENPYITVQSNMLELHVTRGDVNTTNVGVGGLFRPEAARKAELTIGDEKLGEAMSSIPADAWPYGRVVAIEEAHHTPAAAEPTVRRNMEATIARLANLGIQVYDPTDGKLE
jgi:hypothetical protein